MVSFLKGRGFQQVKDIKAEDLKATCYSRKNNERAVTGGYGIEIGRIGEQTSGLMLPITKGDTLTNSDSTPLIDLTSVTKAYKTDAGLFMALKGIDLHINAGEFVAIVGK